MSEHDDAVAFSLRYLDTIENHLHITWNEQEQPVCVIDRIDDASIDSLRQALDDLLGGPLAAQAREQTAKYGKQHVQTVGFGHASNFSEFVKLGFIYGERVVLWDVLASRMLVKGNTAPRLRSVLAETACNLLLLRPVVEQGGLVVLPHPVSWSPLALSIDVDLRTRGNRCAATLGLSMALAAIEEGLPLHPYTLLVDGHKPAADASVADHRDDFYSNENYVFQSAVSALLKDQRVAYLRDVPAAEFYRVVAQHPDLQHALRAHFLPGLQGLSPQQSAAEVDHLISDMVGMIETRNKTVAHYVMEGVETSAGFALTTLATFKLDLPLLQSIVMGATIGVPLTTAVRKWKQTPEKNVIVQAFRQFDAVPLPLAASSTLRPARDPAADNAVILPSIAQAYDTFMSFHWTEERHHFLETLSPEVARQLLMMLDQDDLEIIVNYRKFQQDYIGDYLSYLWNLDEAAFWQHLGKTFESEDGLLIYDSNEHIEIMSGYDMPLAVWHQLLDSLLNAHRGELQQQEMGYPLECFPEIVRFQTQTASDFEAKQQALIAWFSAQKPSDKALARWFLDQTYDNELPPWLAATAKA